MQIILYKNAYFVYFSTIFVNLSPFVGSFFSPNICTCDYFVVPLQPELKKPDYDVQ